ncbi:hypothetical protein K501DRAFT_285508 [Backusella circina FSU 941]|nr:hypothetical protein K501DRAFT_289705 [Backusella circina FSU 941]KAI8883107.1 hypothetical protein K501DRAFT_285508 [Backusella circina FSU 941]
MRTQYCPKLIQKLEVVAVALDEVIVKGMDDVVEYDEITVVPGRRSVTDFVIVTIKDEREERSDSFSLLRLSKIAFIS